VIIKYSMQNSIETVLKLRQSIVCYGERLKEIDY
jgi:hypothetical protein